MKFSCVFINGSTCKNVTFVEILEKHVSSEIGKIVVKMSLMKIAFFDRSAENQAFIPNWQLEFFEKKQHLKNPNANNNNNQLIQKPCNSTPYNFTQFKFNWSSSMDKNRKATIRPKRRFVPSDNSSQIPKSDNSSQATIRPILKRRQFVPIFKSCNLSPI